MLYHLNLFGRQFTVNTYGCGLNPAEEQEVVARFTAAVTCLNAHRAQFDATILEAISKIESVITPASNTVNLGDSSATGMTLSLSYIREWSPQWLASLFAHEGQHRVNHGKYSGANLWRDEQVASRVQQTLGKIILMPQNELDWLTKWSDDSNAAALQQHMGGYSGPA